MLGSSASSSGPLARRSKQRELRALHSIVSSNERLQADLDRPSIRISAAAERAISSTRRNEDPLVSPVAENPYYRPTRQKSGCSLL